MTDLAETGADTSATESDATDQTQGQDVEAKARRTGWRPKEEFDGPAEKWVPADEFVKRGETNAATVKQLEKLLDKANTEIAGMKETFSEFRDYHTKTVQSQYQRAMKDLEARQTQAIEDGDVEGAKAATREITDLTKEMADKPAQKQPAEADTKAAAKAVKDFQAANPWFGEDDAMTGAAERIAAKLQRQGMTDPEEQLAEVAKRIRAEFPHKFENPRRKEAAAVEGTQGAARKNGKTFNDLPPEAKAMCAKFEKQGLLKRDDYVRDYFTS